MIPHDHPRDPLQTVERLARIFLWAVAAALPAILAVRLALRLAAD